MEHPQPSRSTTNDCATRHTALAALSQLATEDPDACHQFCVTSELRVVERADGTGDGPTAPRPLASDLRP